MSDQAPGTAEEREDETTPAGDDGAPGTPAFEDDDGEVYTDEDP